MAFNLKTATPDTSIESTAFLFGADSQSSSDPSVFAVSTVLGLLLKGAGTNTLDQRNSTNAQTFNLYNTYTDASNYERGFFKWNSNVLEIGAEAAGTGTARTMRFFNSGTSQLNMTIDPAGATVGFTRNGINYLRATGIGGQLALGTSAAGGRVDSILVTGSAVEIREDIVLMANLPTADPTNAGQLWNNSGVLTVSAG